MEKSQTLIELKAKEHQVLVDAEIVDLVPVLTKDIEEGVHPLHLSVKSFTHGKLRKYTGHFFRDCFLVDGFISVPHH